MPFEASNAYPLLDAYAGPCFRLGYEIRVNANDKNVIYLSSLRHRAIQIGFRPSLQTKSESFRGRFG